MRLFLMAIGASGAVLSACTTGFQLTTPATPGAEPITRAELTRTITAAERRNSVIITHHDATQSFETHYRVLNPTTDASIEAAARQVCRKIDSRFFAARVIRHDPPRGAPVGHKLYFACI